MIKIDYSKINYSKIKYIFSKNNLFIKLKNNFNRDTFEKVTSIDGVRLKYKKEKYTVIHPRGEINRDNDIEVSLYNKTDDIELYSGFIAFTDIPYDLMELLEERDIHFKNAGSLFDQSMLRNDLFDYGGTRASHRLVTNKAKNLEYYEIIKILTDLDKETIEKIELENSRSYKEKKLFEYAKELDFIVIDKDISKYIDYANRRK